MSLPDMVYSQADMYVLIHHYLMSTHTLESHQTVQPLSSEEQLSDGNVFPNTCLIPWCPSPFCLRGWAVWHMRVHAGMLQSLQSRLTFSDPVDCSPPASPVHGSLQARMLEWVAMTSSRGPSQPRDRTRVSSVSCTAGGFFSTEPPGKPCGTHFLLNSLRI